MPDKNGSPFRHFMSEEAKKVFARWIFNIVALVAVMWVWQPLRDFIVAMSAIPKGMETLVTRVDTLDAKLSRVAGETRVISEVSAAHYVTEPVYKGDKVILNLNIRRTAWGSPCVLLYRTGLFTDASNIVLSGDRVIPARQASGNPEIFRLELDHPDDLQTGRVSVSLSLIYDCDGKTIVEYTTPVAFMLRDPQTRPSKG